MGTASPVVLGLTALFGFLPGCAREQERTHPSDPRPVASQASIAATPLSGSLLGQPFGLKSARYTLDRRPGYEALELHLVDVSSEPPCKDLSNAKPARVWLRNNGARSASAGVHRVAPGSSSTWEAHYEVHQGGKWLGNGRANALIVIDEVQSDRHIEGSLKACFGDASASCVEGRFTANYCPIEIDAPVRGAHVMEPAPSRTLPNETVAVGKLGVDGSRIAIEPREQLLPTYPCSRCHDSLEPRTKKYRLTKFHSVRNDDFSHGEDQFWCYQCHSDEDIDRLRTATGKQVSFNQAYLICTSCHGDKLEDWRVGVHGLILGNYNGAKFKKSCPACHDPHAPRFPLMKPEPPPASPREWSTL